jgi:hypothetical protein
VRIAGDEVASVGRFLHVPEEWERRQRAASTRSLIVAIATGLVFGGLLVSAAVGSVVAWSRRRYTPRLFVAGALTMFAVSALSFVNGWPSVLAQLQTALPFRLQILGIVGVGFIALTLTSVLVGLALGGLPHRLTISGRLPDRVAAQLGVALGLVGVALAAAAAWLRTPAWASFPDIAPVGTLMPIVEVALDPVTGFLTRTAILVVLLAVIHEITAGWTRRRLPGALALVIVGFLGSGPPVGMEIGGWIAAGMLTGAGLLAAYVGLVRADLTVAPLALGTMGAVGALARGAGRPFPAALAGSIVAAVIVAGLAWWWFRALRQWTVRVAGPPPSETVAV